METAATDKSSNRQHLKLDADFDVEALRQRYQDERTKRLRKDGVRQYFDMSGEFGYFEDDPYVEPGFTRDPVSEEVDVAIIGGGFGGLVAAARLIQAGFHRIKVIEKAGDFGGVWYWNRYPGAMCDTDSNIYLPLLEETGYVAPRARVSGSEIMAHAQRIGETFDLYRRALFQTGVSSQTWLPDEDRWDVRTDRGDSIRARFVVTSSGPMQRPKLPGISGIKDFKGHNFHTSRWDYAYTGGDAESPLTKLADKRVAVVGTGCTSIQCIPPLADSAQHLYVVQRTPITISSLADISVDPSWVRSLAPGWQRRRNENFTGAVSGGLQIANDSDGVDDGWTRTIALLNAIPPGMSPMDFEPADLELAMELADFRVMNGIRDRIDEVVKDKATAEALKPWYRFMCKRPGFVEGYLDIFNRPNVTLLDTHGFGIERITENAVVVSGQEYKVDCIVFATGFEVGTNFTRRIGYDIRGQDGVNLSEHWADGPRTMHGLYSHNFPNLFYTGPVQGGISTNIPHLLDEQAHHIAELLKTLRSRGARRFEVSAAAEDAWIQEVRKRSEPVAQFAGQCTPGYFNTEGEFNKHGLVENVFQGGPLEFFNMIRDWRNDGKLEGLEIAYRD